MRKALVFLFVLLTICSGVFAQGGKEADNRGNEITIWTENVAITNEMFDAAIKGFNEKYPDITVNYEIFPGADRATKFTLAKESGGLPTIFLGSTFAFMDEIHYGTVAPVTDLVNKYKGTFALPSSCEAGKFKDDYYFLPTSVSYFGLLYNADFFRAAGLEEFVPEDPFDIATWTLDDFENVILPALRDSFQGTDKYPLVLFAGNEQADTHMLNMLKILGGEVFKDNNLYAGKDEKTIAALEKLKEWMDKGYTNSNVATKLGTEAGPDFQNLKSAINMGQYTNYLTFTNMMEEGKSEKFDLRVATVPTINGNIITSYVSAFFLLNVDEQERENGKLFLDYLYGEGLQYLAPIQETGVPVSKEINEAAAEKYPIFASYAECDQYNYDFTGGTPGYAGTRKYLSPALQSVFSGTNTAEEALKTYQENAEKVINEFKQNSAVLN